MTSLEILERQRTYFKTGATLSAAFRKRQLKRLQKVIAAHEQDIYAALRADLGKSDIESYMCEYALVTGELDYMLRHLKGFSRARRAPTSIVNFPARSRVLPAPKGCALIVSPWNYPFMLSLEPLVDAIAAGNCAVIKPSAYSPATTQIICRIIEECFPPEYVTTVTGGREVNADLFSLPFDHIFFTGSKAVGREVLKSSAENLCSVTLELGGKSPCIVDKTADIKRAARRIVFGKLMNVGQTCVAPDYVLVHESVKEELIAQLKAALDRQYGGDCLHAENYGRIISRRHFESAVKLLEGQNIARGGGYDTESLKIEPTLVLDPDLDSPVMTTEIFAPILPIVTYRTENEALEIISRNPSPLALYVFTRDKRTARTFTEGVVFGGGCVNDTIMHITTPRLPFGGTGASGLGAYHGRRGFEEFSHYKSILTKSPSVDIPLRYRPYSKLKIAIIKALFK